MHEFRARAAQRIDEIQSAAGSVVLVSHNMAEIARSCDRVAWLHEGVLRSVGGPREVVDAYLSSTGSG